jgi:hypothetical protein
MSSAASYIKERTINALALAKKEQAEKETAWKKERKNLLQKCLFSIDRLEKLLTETSQQFKTIFTSTAAKDELFKMFYGNGSRIGKYFFLPLFCIDPTKDDYFELVLTWNICTTEISFKIHRDGSDDRGSGRQIVNNFFSVDEIKEIKRTFLNSNYDQKATLLETINTCNDQQPLFITKLAEQPFLKEEKKFLDFLLLKYATSAERSITFSRRSKKQLYSNFYEKPHKGGITLKRYAWITFGDSKYLEERALELLQELFEEGYPDSQMIMVNTVSERAKEEDSAWKNKTVGWTRKGAEKLIGSDQLARHQNELLIDEPRDYSAHMICAPGD